MIMSTQVSNPTIVQLPRNTGQVLTINEQKAAVYKDEQGNIHAFSAICTHQGCAVTWNQSEQAWDCPCHGSRFSTDGKVVKGPATEPLATISP